MLALCLLPPAPANAQDGDKHVYVTVLGSDGAPIDGLTAEHFAVRESGRERPVVKVERLQLPMHVAVLVDTSSVNGVPDEALRSAVVQFVERLAGFNQVAVYSFGDRAAKVISFTQDPVQLRHATSGMFGWSHQRSHLLDAVDLALRDMEPLEIRRPVIIAITSESPESSGKTAGGVIKRLIGQSVAFHAVSLGGGVASGATRVSRDIPASSQRLGAMVAAGEGDRERDQLLLQGTSATGGGRQRLTSVMALGPALTRLSGELSNSYLVTFSRPGSTRIKELQIGIMLEGVTLRATAAPFGTR
jgi:VWFA-related protein